MTLTPNEQFLIARQLEDSADTATYYLRAIIKDIDGTTIDTVNLTDGGNQYFYKKWLVVSSNTINGKYIAINIFVYTDASYTTLSTLYGVRSDTYLIFQRLNANQSFGGGGVIDYREVGKMVAEEIKKIEFPKQPKQELPKVTDFTPIIKEITKTINDRIDKIPIPEKLEKIDLSPLDSGIKRVITEITSRPKFEKTNLEPFIPEMKKLHESMARETHQEYIKMMAEHSKKLEDVLKKAEEIMDSISDDNAKMKLLEGLRNGTVGFEMLGNSESKKKKQYLESLKQQFGL